MAVLEGDSAMGAGVEVKEEKRCKSVPQSKESLTVRITLASVLRPKSLLLCYEGLS